MEVLGSSCESQGRDQGLALYLRECTEYRMYGMVEWQTKQITSVYLNVKVELFDVLRVEMSWCRPSVVRLTQVIAFKALKAWNKWISVLIFEPWACSRQIFPTVKATTFWESSHGKMLRVGMPQTWWYWEGCGQSWQYSCYHWLPVW